MANNDEYTDEYNDEYLCRDFFVGFNFWWRLSFQIIRISSSLGLPKLRVSFCYKNSSFGVTFS